MSLMEFKEQKNHYLHPDFEETNVNNKQSPLALLAQACKNIGSLRDNKIYQNNDKTDISNLTINRIKKRSNRSRSDSSSNSSLFERDQIIPSKRMKIENNQTEKVVINNDDTSSETSYSSNSSLFFSLLHIFKNSTSSELTDSNKMDLLHLLTGQSYDKGEKTKLSKSNTRENKNQFNVMNGYHLESSDESTGLDNSKHYQNSTNFSIDNSRSTNLYNNPAKYMGQCSSIKYCMYCGKLIPILPMLLAHMRLEHNPPKITDISIDNVINYPMTHTHDSALKFNPFMTSELTNSKQSLSFMSDYLSSSFNVLNGLIC